MAVRTALLRPQSVIAGLIAICSAAAVCACQCGANTEVVCGEDGNSYQNACLAECQGVAVAAAGACTAASNVGVKMAQAFAASAAASDSSLLAAMSAHGVAFTPQHLDQIAAAAASVANGFASDASRLVTAADMARLEKQGMVLVGLMKAVGDFKPEAPPVPADAAERPSEPYENFGATEAAMTADGLLFKPKLLAKHAAMVAIAAAKAASEMAAALGPPGQQQGSSPAHQASVQGLVSLQSFQPDDLTKDQGSEGGEDPDNGAEGPEPDDPTGADGSPQDPEAAAGNRSDKEDNRDSPQLEAGVSGVTQHVVLPPPLTQSLGRRHLSTVFLPDDRVELTTRQKSLIRAVGRITYDMAESPTTTNSYFCSGAVIGRFTVLTAAHCVMSISNPGVTATSWTFAAGFNKWGPDSRYGRVAASHFVFDTRFWDKDSWYLWDMAIVVLQKAVGLKTGYFGVGFKPRGYHGPLYTAGYPGDKPLWSFWTIDSNTSCVVEDDNGLDTVLKHKCDTYGGQSGSPMWIAGTNTILGVVSWEQPDINGACAVNAYWYRFVRSHRSGRPLPKRLQSGGGRHH